jgi:hypothetical protein
MTARVINDPAALGWEFDPDTGRWTWGGSDGGSSGGGDVDLSPYINRNVRNDVLEGTFQILWDDSADPTYPFNGRIGYSKNEPDPNAMNGSFLYVEGSRGTFSIGRDGDVELHGPSEIQGVEDREGNLPWITGFSYVQAADFRDADGNSIIGSGGGSGTVTTADVQLTNPTLFMPDGLATQEDANTYVEQCLAKLIDEDGNVIGGGNGYDDSQIKAELAKETQDRIDGDSALQTQIDSLSGGGGGNDPRITNTQISNWDTAYGWGDHNGKGYLTSASLNGYATESWVTGKGYLTSASLNGYATQTWVSQNYQPKGSYASTSYAYSKSESDQKYELKGAGGGFDGTYTGDRVTFTCTNTVTALSLNAPNCGIQMSGTGSTGKYMRINSDSWQILTGNYATMLMSVNDNGIVTATDFIATSDRNKKDHIETAPTGVIGKLRGVTFQWKQSGEESSGVIAQELQDAGLGHLVHEGDEGLSVSYGGLTAYLIEEEKLLRKELEALKNDS